MFINLFPLHVTMFFTDFVRLCSANSTLEMHNQLFVGPFHVIRENTNQRTAVAQEPGWLGNYHIKFNHKTLSFFDSCHTMQVQTLISV